jgi:hypothetical protein
MNPVVFLHPILVCGQCGYGNYVVANCSAAHNIRCAPCTQCGSMQYAQQQCVRGQNAVCNSCQQCSFPDPAVRAACEADKGYVTWKDTHCCVDTYGNKVCCMGV